MASSLSQGMCSDCATEHVVSGIPDGSLDRVLAACSTEADEDKACEVQTDTRLMPPPPPPPTCHHSRRTLDDTAQSWQDTEENTFDEARAACGHFEERIDKNSYAAAPGFLGQVMVHSKAPLSRGASSSHVGIRHERESSHSGEYALRVTGRGVSISAAVGLEKPISTRMIPKKESSRAEVSALSILLC